jgi:hypothetical protein
MLQRNLFGTLLVALFLICACSTSLLVLSLISSTRKLQALFINRQRGLMQGLAMETIQYSKKNPAIDPILQNAGIKPKPGGRAPAGMPTPIQHEP